MPNDCNIRYFSRKLTSRTGAWSGAKYSSGSGSNVITQVGTSRFCAQFFSPSSAGLVSALDPIDDFLDSFAAADNLTMAPVLSNTAPATVPLGETMISFSASDEAGNRAQCSVSATVRLNTRAAGAWRYYD